MTIQDLLDVTRWAFGALEATPAKELPQQLLYWQAVLREAQLAYYRTRRGG